MKVYFQSVRLARSYFSLNQHLKYEMIIYDTSTCTGLYCYTCFIQVGLSMDTQQNTVSDLYENRISEYMCICMLSHVDRFT